MKNFRTFIFILPVILFLNGCVVYSLEPFFYADNKIKTPEFIIGEWSPVKLEGEDVSEKNLTPWKFGSDAVICYDKKNNAGEIDFTFFKVNDQLFCDTQAGSSDDKAINQYWLFHLYPFHTLCKVNLKDDTLTFIPFNYRWIEERVAAGAMKMEFVEGKSENIILFTATSYQWENFIKEHIANQEAFSKEHAFVFKKKLNMPSPKVPRSGIRVE